MLRNGILHPQLKKVLASCAHQDWIGLVDSGFGIPLGPERVDLAFLPNIPTTLQVLDAILAEFSVEKIILATEIQTMAPDMLQEIISRAEKTEIEFMPWVEFKPAMQDCKAIVRSGDWGIHAGNMILVGGCVY